MLANPLQLAEVRGLHGVALRFEPQLDAARGDHLRKRVEPWIPPTGKRTGERHSIQFRSTCKFGHTASCFGDVAEGLHEQARIIVPFFHRRVQIGEMARSPRLTGTPWDALLAAVTEHLAWEHELEPPEWVHEPDRFCNPPWLVTDWPKGEPSDVDPERFSPPAIRRHGTLIDPRSLDSRGVRSTTGRPAG